MYYNEFLNHIEKVRRYSLRTVNSYRDDLVSFDNFISSIGVTANAVTTRTIYDYISYLADKGMKPTSVNQHLSALRSYFDFCCRFGYATSNPAASVRDMRTPKLLPKFIQEERMNFLIDHLLPSRTYKEMRTRIVILIFYHTGIRCSEMAGLTDASFNLSANYVKVLGKGNKERIIPFGKELHNEITKYISMRNKEFNYKGKGFLLTIWGTRLDNFQIRRICKYALRKIVPDALCHPHVLRHTFATVLMNHGARIENIAKLMGHASIDTTSIYQHVSVSYLRQSYSKAFDV